MSASEIDRINKPELKRALLAVMKEGKEDPGGDREIIAMLKMILDEISLMREERKEFMNEIDALRKDNEELRRDYKTLEAKVEKQVEVIQVQQRFFEKLDQKERGPNLIIVGIKEDQQADGTKVTELLSTIDRGQGTLVANVKKVKRIGSQDNGKIRPIQVTVASEEERNEIVRKAREFTGMGTVRVKKDCHPAVRAEWKRLFDVKEMEGRYRYQ